jgi:prepilin signal peptidase PulO-like enzyme (type II secretory pathway)
MYYLFIFVFGLCVGSFLGVLIYREANEDNYKKFIPSWVCGRSYCDNCHRLIRWHDNIPLLSFFLLRGRCRYCRQKITIQYPLVELLTGLEFIWIYWLVKNNVLYFSRLEGFYSLVVLIYWLLLGAVFLMIVISDLKYQIIPDSGVVMAIVLILARKYFDYFYTGYLDFSFIPASFLAALFFYGIILITRGKGMGFGDVKLAFVLGLLLGWPGTLVAVYFSFIIGGVIAIGLLLTGKKKMKQAIAFGPFLIVGAVVAQLVGSNLLEWYSRLIF